MNQGFSDRFAFRPFGRLSEDLELDFESSSRSHLVTRLLWQCALNGNDVRPDPAVFWRLTVGERIACLLQVASCDGNAPFILTLTCQNPVCRRQMEMHITVDELLDEHRTAMRERTVAVTAGAKKLVLRRPTGQDQKHWEENSFNDEQSARDTIIRTLLADSNVPLNEGSISDDLAEAVVQAMERFDPLVNQSIGARCPYCEDEHTYDVDVEELVLNRMEGIQRDLLYEIHRLARYYHWSESQILALSPRRRSRYLVLIDREEQA